MRPHKRDVILRAAFEVIERDGVAELTIEAVAGECGLTRAGVQYHFGTRELLFQAVQEWRAVRWDGLLRDKLGADPAAATLDERLAAYAEVSEEPASTGELLLMLEASRRPEHRHAYGEVAQHWLPDLSQISPDDSAAVTRLLVQVASDGLWVADSIGSPIPAALRKAISARIIALISHDVSTGGTDPGC
ncbi:transcriptional repressor BetI (plasmid) [Variovorax sp. PBS-H4]|uniref:TetR/AcrR family transcriptional regulator n=1 Tax=Variovorax sp. PBS-H4 TaxID=434008 RepID=UPI0013185F3C|nr:TetR family transcriptional regulator [Variovorax sp. PBS-H4]VTU41420.1 transcriptional repressor BetI [Variovorax sp. PBS-H4]